MKCQFYNCRFPAEKGKRYCGGHYKMMGDEVLPGLEEEKPEEEALAKPGIAKTKTKIAPFSKKREKLQRKYRKQVEEALSENNQCEVNSPVCIYEANGFQHIEKRTTKNLMVKSNQLRCCAACQIWIEENPRLAIEMGVSKSKFKKAI